MMSLVTRPDESGEPDTALRGRGRDARPSSRLEAFESEESKPRSGDFLVAKNLSARGPEGEIFSGLTISAARGEIVLIAGDNGSGRTSALLTLVGRFRHTGGYLTIDGHGDPADIQRLSTIATAPPAVEIEPYLTVAQLVTETSLVGAVKERDIWRMCQTLSVRADSGDTYVRLPALEQNILALALAAAQRTPVIVVDNIDANTDAAGMTRLWAAMRQLSDIGRLIVVTALRADRTADQIVRLTRKGAAAARVTVPTGVMGRDDQ